MTTATTTQETEEIQANPYNAKKNLGTTATLKPVEAYKALMIP